MADWFSVIVIVIVTTGASCLGELLKVNNSLQELDMGHNYAIGDDGMSSVADGLQYNKTLIKLIVQWCRLSVKGTVVYKIEFKIICPLQFSYSCSIFIQIMLINTTLYSIRNDQTIVLTSISCGCVECICSHVVIV